MSRQNYGYSTATASRHASSHGSSSAFSSSANPDEDWTKISDLAERRRIQNRIAQRNYRKKLKRRLEDLERRAGSSSASPPQVHAEVKQEQRPAEHVQQYRRSPEFKHQQFPPRILASQYTPPLSNEDDLMFTHSFEREGSRTPPLFTYSTYPAPEDTVYPSYQHSQPYRPVASSGDRDSYSDYMSPLPAILPSMMQFHDSMKRDGDDHLSLFNMCYQGLPSNDSHEHTRYDESPHTPPLSHSYEHSTTCSESGYQYPTTPLSMPPSPRLITQL